MLLVLGVANIALRAQSHQVEDGVLWADQRGVTAVEIADDRRLRGRPRARRRPAGGQRHTHRASGRRARVPASRHRGTTLSYTLVRLGSRQVLQVELAPVPRGARCTSSWRPSASSRCSSAHRCGCGVRAIRRRCISSGSASRFSAPSRFRSTVRSIGSTGSSTGGTRWRRRCCRRCCCISRSCSPSVRSDVAIEPALIVPVVYAPAIVLAAARIVVVSRARLDGPMFSRTIDLLDRGEHLYLVDLRRRRVRRARAGLPRHHVAHRASPAALDRLGHGAWRRAVRIRLRDAVGSSG